VIVVIENKIGFAAVDTAAAFSLQPSRDLRHRFSDHGRFADARLVESFEGTSSRTSSKRAP
jgi:hypothetical protein